MIESDLEPVSNMAARQMVATAGPLRLPIPNHCSDLFATGWALADTLVAKGIDPLSVMSENWHHEKVAGFDARLAAD